jgi:hypothetical protein
VVAAVRLFMKYRAEWPGTHTELLKELNECRDHRIGSRKEWPEKPNLLSRRIGDAEVVLKRYGIEVEHTRDSRNKKITIRNSNPEGQHETPSLPSPE